MCLVKDTHGCIHGQIHGRTRAHQKTAVGVTFSFCHGVPGINLRLCGLVAGAFTQ